jgi:hypothetical protein
MGYASVFPSGGVLADIRRAMHSTVVSIDHLTTSTGRDARTGSDDGASDPSDPYAGDTKWPAWKVTVAIVAFCAAFWTGIGYLAFKLLG